MIAADHPALVLLRDTLAATRPDTNPALQAENVAKLLGHALEATGYALVEPDDLLSTKEVAELLEVDRTTVSRWRSAGYLTAPWRELATGPIWLRPAVERFAEQHRAVADAAGRRPRATA